MSRRNFMRGFLSTGLSAAALGGIPLAKVIGVGEPAVTAEDNPSYASDTVSGMLSEEVKEVAETTEAPQESETHFESLSESRYFNEAVHMFATKYSEGVPLVLEYANKVTVNDPEQRSRLEYVSEELQIDGIPDVVGKELQKYIVGLCNVESDFDASKKSPSGAQGPLQFMPATWKEHGNQAESILSLVAQVDAARSKFRQIYRHLQQSCAHELDAIKAEFFFGDETKFEKEFLTPVIINAFNAGQGTMTKIIEWFLHTYSTQEKTVGIFSATEAVSGYDVFLALAERGNLENASPYYKEEASAYVQKVYGATESLQKYVQRGA